MSVALEKQQPSMAPLEEQASKILRSLRWLPAYTWQRLVRHTPRGRSAHLIIALADHFEPSFMPACPQQYADYHDQERRMERWCLTYPKVMDAWRDSDGQPFRHTYFYPAEQYDKGLIDRLAAHCQDGWGEIEIQVHHGVEVPDTAENTSRLLLEFRDALVMHGCLSRWRGEGMPRYAFVHGNWALANSAGGRYCGVDSEMQILAETGCYADFTLPSAPSPAQVSKINALYECTISLRQQAPHRRGRDLRRGQAPTIYPLIVQGPLGLNFSRRIRGWPVPCIENSAITTAYPPTLERLHLWRRAPITVRGNVGWVFIKLHCHGMDPRDEPAVLGAPMRQFLRELTEKTREGHQYQVHFVTAREMVNIILAACDGREGSPGQYRDYRFQLISTPRAV
jgi:hypothetical protein